MMLTGWTPQVGRWKAESCVKTHIEQHNKEGIDLMGGVDCPFPGCPAPSVKVRGLINRHFSQHHSGKVCCTQCLEVVDAQPQVRHGKKMLCHRMHRIKIASAY